MIKCMVTPASYTTGNISLSTYKNTNDVFQLQNNTILIKKNGIIDIKANIIITSISTSPITAMLYGNGNPIQGAEFTVTPLDATSYTLTLNDVVVVANTNTAGYANASIQFNTGCTIVGGDVICEYRQ